MKEKFIALAMIFAIIFYLFLIFLHDIFQIDLKFFIPFQKSNVLPPTEQNLSNFSGVPNNNESKIINESLGENKGTFENESEKTFEKVVTLRIIDVCSGKLENVFQFSEGVQACLNEKSPYHFELIPNSSHLILNFSVLSNVYEFENDSRILHFVVEDLNTVSNQTPYFYLSETQNFYLGNHTLHYIWIKQADQLKIWKILAVLPLYFKKDWVDEQNEIKVFARLEAKDYLLGSFYPEIKK
jgi:hypothetical protein